MNQPPTLVEVLLPTPFDHGFDYAVPGGVSLHPGDYVEVPFGKKMLVGVVWGEGKGDVASTKIKPISRVLDYCPPMSATMRKYIDWLAAYTLAPKGNVLKMAIPIPEALEIPKKKKSSSPESAKQIIGESTFVTLDSRLRGNDKSIVLSPDQSAALDILRTNMAGFKPTLLDGVTGSGKTEVYFELISDVIAQGKQVLVLLPEIALSVQWLTRFKLCFGFEPNLWHSEVTRAQKRKAWQRVALGETPVTVGARSALFLPYKNLALIVVDEEHDHSYKQEDGVIYQARDMAVARASQEKIPIVLVSATPSLESTVNVEQKRYAYAHLPARANKAELPTIRMIDMREEKLPAKYFLSSALKSALAQTVATGGQAMLFLNRRGYAPLVLCNHCGHRFQCPNCSTWLVLHQGKRQGAGGNSENIHASGLWPPASLSCHHCAYTAPLPKQCPQCHTENEFRACGPGVERIAEEVKEFLPNARLGVMTSEMSESGNELSTLINKMETAEIDILIGTQMVAKGHHFAKLSLVGVVDADMGLSGGDLRAGERTYQLLHQLAGRAGREKLRGEVLIQSFMPEHKVMQALAEGRRDAFMTLEADMRRDALMPPFGRLAALIVEGTDPIKTLEAANALARGIRHWGLGIKDPANPQCPMPSPLVFGPAPAPLFKLRGKTRYRFLVKSPRNFPLQNYIREWLRGIKLPHSVRVKVDIDPYSFL